MPRGDGTGPRGQGSGSGRGKRGAEQDRKGGFSAGPGGFCVCSNCGEKTQHLPGQPCYDQKCPKCGSAMIRE